MKLEGAPEHALLSHLANTGPGGQVVGVQSVEKPYASEISAKSRTGIAERDIVARLKRSWTPPRTDVLDMLELVA